MTPSLLAALRERGPSRIQAELGKQPFDVPSTLNSQHSPERGIRPRALCANKRGVLSAVRLWPSCKHGHHAKSRRREASDRERRM
jgi:hypothetical protein